MTRITLVPLVLLLAYAVAFGTVALGSSPLAFDDHPGQLYRVWHVVSHGFAPWRWNDGWWAGYPELQFYPPGFAYLAALVHMASLARVSVETAYHAVVWLAWLAPGVTTYALLARVLASGWLALPGAFIALTLSAGVTSGVEGGVHIGMVAARLGWAMLPLVALALVRWTEGRAGAPLAVVPLVAVVVLLHPAHVPAAATLVAVTATKARGTRGARLATGAAVLALAAAMTAFWTLPLAARLAETRALAWGGLTVREAATFLVQHPLLVALVVLAAAALKLARAPFERALAWLPWWMAGVVAFDAGVLEPLGARWLPADRVIDGAWFAAIAAAGLATGRLLERAPSRTRIAAAALGVAAVGTFAVLSTPDSTLALWPRRTDWPALDATARGLRFAELSAAVARAPAGRVLFVRSGVPLVYGTAWWRPHTHITALLPLWTGRGIVHGTFTHPSPVAALVYSGATTGGAIRALAETLDGRTLFGHRLEDLSAAVLDPYADRLRVSAIIAVEDDRPALGALGRTARFSEATSPPFVVWTRREAVDVPARDAAGKLRVRARGQAGRFAPLGLTFYPLWRVFDGETELATRRGEAGDLEARLVRADALLELRYEPGVPEIAGVATSLAALVAWAIGVASAKRAALTASGARRGA